MIIAGHKEVIKMGIAEQEKIKQEIEEKIKLLEEKGIFFRVHHGKLYIIFLLEEINEDEKMLIDEIIVLLGKLNNSEPD